MSFPVLLCMPLLLFTQRGLIRAQSTAKPPANSTFDPCDNYTVLDDIWRTTYLYSMPGYYTRGYSGYYGSHDDTTVEWDGWYRLYMQGKDAQMSEWCTEYMTSGGHTPLILGSSHPLMKDGIVIREIYGASGYNSSQCSYRSNPIQVKACPGHYYVYRLVKPDPSIPGPTYAAVVLHSYSYDPCNDYTTLDHPWRANNATGLQVCDYSFDWNGWYRLVYNGMNVRMAESCVDLNRCGTYYPLWLNGPHPQIEDGMVTRQVCASGGSDCCFYKSTPIRVKACPGNFYVYEIVRPVFCYAVYCTDVQTITPGPASTGPVIATTIQNDYDFDPCYNYTVLDDHWRTTLSPYGGHDDTLVEWDGWYQLFLQGKRAQLSEGCVNYMTCGGYTPLVLGGSHPRLEDGIVTREIYAFSTYYCRLFSRSSPVQVKACPGHSYVYRLVKPNVMIPLPTYCAVILNYPTVDPCTNYTVLDQHWRATNNTINHMATFPWGQTVWCDIQFNWNGWYRLFYQGNNAQMPESCVSPDRCGANIPLWLNGSHPRLEDGVVVRKVCGNWNSDCCYFKSHPIQVKACPGNYYVYEFVNPAPCPSAYCTDAGSFATLKAANIMASITNATATSPATTPGAASADLRKTSNPESITATSRTTSSTPELITATSRTTSSTPELMTATSKTTSFIIGKMSTALRTTIVPEIPTTTPQTQTTNTETQTTTPTTKPSSETKTNSDTKTTTKWIFGTAPEKMSTTPRTSTTPKSPIFMPINMHTTPRTISTTVMPATASVNPCEELNCTEDEWCGERNEVYGCFCNPNHPRPHPESYDATEVCESSSGTMSLSRCQLFEAGFPGNSLHLSDPNCRGTVQNGRLVFHFDNDDHVCGTNLTANGTHLIYENTIQDELDLSKININKHKQLELRFSCIYQLTQTLTMETEFNLLQSIVHKTHPGGVGMYQVSMSPYRDAGFSHAYNGRADVEINQRIYVGVFVQGVDSRQITTVIDSCWATPENDRNYGVRWDLIIKKCPNPDDNSVDILQNGVSKTAHFSFKIFSFDGYDKVFLHCAIHLCLRQSNNCAALCQPGLHHRSTRSVDIHDASSISVGPFIWTERSTGEPSQ